MTKREPAGALLLAWLLVLPFALPVATGTLQAQSATPPATAPAGQNPPSPAPAERPGWLEGLLYNPAERTQKGAAALGAGAPRAAAEALDSALRLEPASDRARYNAGTAHLMSTSEAAAPLLESAAQSNDSGVAARAFYNLGNSRLAAKDLPGAIDAYKNSLRRDPSSADAKFNLELALRRLQEQQKQNQQQNKDQQKQDQQNKDEQQQDQQQQDQDQQKQEQQKQDQQQQEKQGEQKDQQDQQEQQQKQDQQQKQQEQQKQGGKPPQEQQPQPGQQGQPESPLPQFKDLPDMDAQQAAAILEAIENLERNQRRDEAKKAQKAHASGKKDW